VPTAYPKSSPTEMMGLLVLINTHKGSEDVALLADDLDLEIDEIFPALEYAEVLQLVTVTDGRASFTDLGKRFVASTIRDRKAILREQLQRTTLFRTLMRALDGSPDHTLTDEQLHAIVAFTTAPADEAVQNIVNWGRYAELFRYDATEHRLIARRRSTVGRTPPASPPPPGTSAAHARPSVARPAAPATSPSPSPETQPASERRLVSA
jgi:NitT/TauT family transport system ATP-binding protein